MPESVYLSSALYDLRLPAKPKMGFLNIISATHGPGVGSVSPVPTPTTSPRLQSFPSQQLTMAPPLSQPQGENPEFLTEQIDLKCIQSTSKEYFDRSMTSDNLRCDPYSMFHRLLDEFDGRMEKYKEALSTTVVFAGVSSLVISVLFIDILSKTHPNPNRMTAAQTKMSLLPDAHPNSAAGTSLLSEIVTTLLAMSFATSLFASSLTLFAIQRINRYLWDDVNGFPAERAHKRLQKVNGLRKWPFHVAIESPLVLWLSLLLFWCALPGYLWANRDVLAWTFVPAALGITSRISLTLPGIRSTNPFRPAPHLGHVR